MLHIPARVVTSAKRSVDDVQKSRFFRSITVKYKLGSRKTLGKTRTTLNAAYAYLSGFPGTSDDAPVVEE